jgi:queuine tRNA-ribosyltransferase
VTLSVRDRTTESDRAPEGPPPGLDPCSRPAGSASVPVWFELQAVDPGSGARAGILHTLHGSVETPVFMPVGTQATVKGLTPDWLGRVGSKMVLANTYHLAIRPGEEVVQALGGLHAMMGWNGPILTDSGGFQAFSMADRRKLSESGVAFRSHLDGRLLDLTPERAVKIQEALGSDVAMVLDHCPALPATKDEVADATFRTIRWADRCRQAHTKSDQALFAIVQGGSHEDLRAECAERLIEMDFPGYAVGGVSVGESREEVRKALQVSTHRLPSDKPRYLMGVGRPQDILEAVETGIDMFDCVLPTRNGRNAHCLTRGGPVKLRNARYRTDTGPVEDGCDCPTCETFSRGTLRHLFLADEMLGPILASAHNLAYLHRLTRQAREAILGGRYVRFKAEVLEELGP